MADKRCGRYGLLSPLFPAKVDATFRRAALSGGREFKANPDRNNSMSSGQFIEYRWV